MGSLARKVPPPKTLQPPKKPKQTLQEAAQRISNGRAEEKRARMEAAMAAKRKAEEDATYAMMYGPNWESRDDLEDKVSAPPSQRRLMVVPDPEPEPENDIDVEAEVESYEEPLLAEVRMTRKQRRAGRRA